ncbi:hypothetical protein E1176_13230 [Fulvivirga sp. RKSG066]|uniref:hypothetical protein n=1 Tax=Fulvivirga aurantia TaxID=2529383 RepID=UPI0012BC16A0|nr:hypothetical protein [Fulvivirga aurantia]MTI21988.1 hypothetical protein [Fulvivirga aurantia]
MLIVNHSNGQELASDSYSSEFVWGINKNTAGGLIGGFVLRKSKQINDRLYESVGLELMNVKHPLETQRRSTLSGNTFIFGKTNYLYAIRLQYGRELILFRKAPQQGVEIKLNAAVGPSIGLQAPYYIEYLRDGGPNTFREQYNPNKHTINCSTSANCIIGTGYLFQGLHESQFKLGGNAKVSLSFELGTSKSNVTGVEAGFLIDAYTSEIELIPTAENKGVFPTAFVTMFYGSRR